MHDPMPTDPPTAARRSPRDALADPALRRTLEDFVRRRVGPSDVDDVVQTVLVDALAAADRPEEGEALRKWIIGVARHKVADLHRARGRERPTDPPEEAVAPPPV